MALGPEVYAKRKEEEIKGKINLLYSSYFDKLFWPNAYLSKEARDEQAFRLNKEQKALTEDLVQAFSYKEGDVESQKHNNKLIRQSSDLLAQYMQEFSRQLADPASEARKEFNKNHPALELVPLDTIYSIAISDKMTLLRDCTVGELKHDNHLSPGSIQLATESFVKNELPRAHAIYAYRNELLNLFERAGIDDYKTRKLLDKIDSKALEKNSIETIEYNTQVIGRASTDLGGFYNNVRSQENNRGEIPRLEATSATILERISEKPIGKNFGRDVFNIVAQTIAEERMKDSKKATPVTQPTSMNIPLGSTAAVGAALAAVGMKPTAPSVASDPVQRAKPSMPGNRIV